MAKKTSTRLIHFYIILLALLFHSKFFLCSVETCSKSWVKGYECVYKAERFSFHWRKNANKIKFNVLAETNGWIAISFTNEEKKMCDTLVYEKREETQVNSITAYTFQENSFKIEDKSYRVSGSKATSRKGKINLRFEKRYGDGRCPLMIKNISTIFWAYGSKNRTFNSEFNNVMWNSFQVNWNGSLENLSLFKNPHRVFSKEIKPNSMHNSMKSTLKGSSSSSSKFCQTSNLRGYKCSIDLRGSEYVLHWKPRNGKVALAFESASTLAWLSLGWSANGKMVGSEAVIGKGGNHPSIKVYSIEGKTNSDVIENNSFTILSPRYQSHGGKTYLKFERIYGTGKYPFNVSGLTTIIWASSLEDGSEFGFHGLNYGIVQVDFSTGNSIQVSSENDKFRRIHGLCMWIAFGILLPIGIIFSRYNDILNLMSVWFPLHWFIQTLGIVLAIAAGVVGFVKFRSLRTIHGGVGCAVLSLVVVQFVLGTMFRPPVGGKLRASWRVTHAILGTFTIFLGQVNIYLGLILYGTKTSNNIRVLFLIISIQASLFTLGFFALEAAKLRCKKTTPIPTFGLKPVAEEASLSSLKGSKSKRWRSLRHNNAHWSSALPH